LSIKKQDIRYQFFKKVEVFALNLFFLSSQNLSASTKSD